MCEWCLPAKDFQNLSLNVERSLSNRITDPNLGLKLFDFSNFFILGENERRPLSKISFPEHTEREGYKVPNTRPKAIGGILKSEDNFPIFQVQTETFRL